MKSPSKQQVLAEEKKERVEELNQRQPGCRELQQKLEESGAGEISTTDLEARLIASINHGLEVR